MNEVLLIGELAARVGVTAKTIRYYEQVGLVPRPRRSGGGYRLYSAEYEGRLRFIANARDIGFSLGEIKEILALREQGRRPCGYVVGAIERRIREIDEHQAQLRALKSDLIRLRERAANVPASTEEDGVYCHVLQDGSGGSSPSRV